MNPSNLDDDDQTIRIELYYMKNINTVNDFLQINNNIKTVNNISKINTISNLKILTFLDISLNNISELISFKNLIHLKWLYIDMKNEFKEVILEYISQDKHRLKKTQLNYLYYESLFISSSVESQQSDCNFTLFMLRNGIHFNMNSDSQVKKFLASCQIEL